MSKTLSVNSLNKLGSIINTSFAKSSSPTGTFSVIFSLHENVLTCKYMTIVQFASDNALQSQIVRIHDESNALINSKIVELKKEFFESAAVRLKVKELSSNDGLELISSTANSDKKVAYFRVNKKFDIGE